MVRTASTLYQWTGDMAYADYIELNLYNGFLAQQNKYTGMPRYFLPLKAGSTKKWGSPTSDFWCCYGTIDHFRERTNIYSIVSCSQVGKG